MPSTLGTATPDVVGWVGVGVGDGDGEPVETTMFTVEPLSTFSSAAGSWLMTDPAGTVVLVCCVTVPSLRPAAVIALVASVCVMLVRSGTVACGLPLLTQYVTVSPRFSSVSAAGSCLNTCPPRRRRTCPSAGRPPVRSC